MVRAESRSAALANLAGPGQLNTKFSVVATAPNDFLDLSPPHPSPLVPITLPMLALSSQIAETDWTEDGLYDGLPSGEGSHASLASPHVLRADLRLGRQLLSGDGARRTAPPAESARGRAPHRAERASSVRAGR